MVFIGMTAEVAPASCWETVKPAAPRGSALAERRYRMVAAG
jgi:hypothetical protein